MTTCSAILWSKYLWNWVSDVSETWFPQICFWGLCGPYGSHNTVCRVRKIFDPSLPHSSSSSRRCSPGWALTSSTIRLHRSLFLAFSIHPLIPNLLRSAITSSSHLILGLPILLVAYSFPFSTLLGMAVSSILSTWPSHCILCAFISSPLHELTQLIVPHH